MIPGDNPGRFVGVGADDRVYTTSFNPPILYSLQPNGRLVWSLDLGNPSGKWPITFAADGTIYTGAVGVRAVNPDGTLRWAFDGGAWILAGPSVGPDGNIYAADDVNTGGLGVYSIDPDGNLRWSDPGDPGVSGLYEYLDEIVFGSGYLFGGIKFPRSGPWISTYAFDFAGNQEWFRYYGSEGGPSSNPRMLKDGRLIFRSGQGGLVAVNPSGIDDWVAPHPDGAQLLLQPVVGTDGAIYAGDEYGVQLWSSNPDGTTRWVLPGNIDESLSSLGVSPDNGVLIASGWTYVQADGLNHGWIRGYDPADGELLWQLDLGHEQGTGGIRTEVTRTVRPAFSSNGDRAYVTTWFTGADVGHTYLYSIAIRESATVGMNEDGSDRPGGPLVSISANPCFGPPKIVLRGTSDSSAAVIIYDVTGREVRRLFQGPLPGSELQLGWDLRDNRNRAVGSGVYFVKGQTAGGSAAIRVVVVR